MASVGTTGTTLQGWDYKAHAAITADVPTTGTWTLSSPALAQTASGVAYQGWPTYNPRFAIACLNNVLEKLQLVEDSTLCDVASADYLLMFRKRGENKSPVWHPSGLSTYAGSRQVPHELAQWRGHKGKQTENRWSHWIWRQWGRIIKQVLGLFN